MSGGECVYQNWLVAAVALLALVVLCLTAALYGVVCRNSAAANSNNFNNLFENNSPGGVIMCGCEDDLDQIN